MWFKIWMQGSQSKTQKRRFTAAGRRQSQESFEISKNLKKNQVIDFAQKVNYHPQVNLNNSNSNSNKTFCTIATKYQQTKVTKCSSIKTTTGKTIRSANIQE